MCFLCGEIENYFDNAQLSYIGSHASNLTTTTTKKKREKKIGLIKSEATRSNGGFWFSKKLVKWHEDLYILHRSYYTQATGYRNNIILNQNKNQITVTLGHGM